MKGNSSDVVKFERIFSKVRATSGQGNSQLGYQLEVREMK
jgi:hypothetical protein